jgi:hypothetical protein
MLKNTPLIPMIAAALSMLVLAGCGGTGSAPINGGSLARIAVSVAPPTMKVTTGTTQPFTATVINTTETGVGWLVNGFPGGVNPTDGTSPFGTIDKDGNYTAPSFIPSPPTVTVTAVAKADNNATASASVSINGTPSPVSISPLAASLEVGGITLFTATVNGPDPSVNWLVENVPGGNEVVGTIYLIPGTVDKVNYVAPLSVPGGGQTAQIHVTAQSAAHFQETASAVVTLSPLGKTVVAITSPPVPPTVPGGQTQPFQASVTGASDTTVTWEVDAIAGGNANVGTIATGAKGTAVYTAPEKVLDAFQVIVTAVSNAQPAAQASILVNVIPAQKVTVTISADECTNTDAIPINTTAAFTATVLGLTNQDVTWQVNQITGGNSTVGTITDAGVYTAPARVPNPATVTVSAVSVAEPQEGIGKESVTITSIPVTKILVAPTSASVQVGLGQNFTATVMGMGDANTAVDWEVDGEVGGDDTIGTIQQGAPSGCVSETTYVAPESIPNPNPVTVTAVASDGTSSPGVPVTIQPPPSITLALMPGQGDPQTVQVQTANDKVQYTASQYKDGDQETTDPVSWTLTSKGQDCSVSHGSICGTITPGGIVNEQFTATYTAPNTVPPVPKVTVTVTSVVDPGASDFNDITISNGPPTIAISGPGTVQAGTGPYSYTAIITGADPDLLVWQLGCISDWDGISPDGNCLPTREDDFKDGPGCITYGRAKICGAGGDLTIPAQNPLSYVPPLTVSTNDYLQNACTLNGDPHASVVPINVSMQATGCPGNPPTCTAIACVTVTPP